MSEADSGQSGFTLVETLVAFTILAGAIIVSLQIFAAGLRQQDAVEQRKDLMAVARAELDRLALQSTLDPGITSGRSGGIEWQVMVTELGPGKDAQGLTLRPFHATFRVIVAGGESGDEPVLETVLLARRKAP
jgi:type II secretory pathway pseudopilin PulG